LGSGILLSRIGDYAGGRTSRVEQYRMAILPGTHHSISVLHRCHLVSVPCKSNDVNLAFRLNTDSKTGDQRPDSGGDRGSVWRRARC
jgi:hypothetical protein